MNISAFPHGRFEGSYLGDRARLAPTARLECKVCWHVYDPAEGCDTWQVPPGTAFNDLPDDWRCPVCDGARDQFMVLDGGAAGATAVVDAPSPEDAALDETLRTLPGRLEAVFQEINASRMKGVPFVNGALSVKAVGFRILEGRLVGVLVTPWFMNIIALPKPGEDWTGLPTGTRALMDFPSGTYEFLSAERPETGPYRACSLFSPMFDFSSMLQAVETAEAIIPALLDPANREEGSRAGEIRRRAEDAAARQAEEEAAQRAALEAAADAPARETPSALSRRALIFGPGLASQDVAKDAAGQEATAQEAGRETSERQPGGHPAAEHPVAAGQAAADPMAAGGPARTGATSDRMVSADDALADAGTARP
ncbi:MULTISPECIES: [NiFe]-hydrogenase assembly chaperone HybE [unclassified Xanthobacter]|uniref:[NiFe]-hydrogenase assembly chaperone HybE n=1 Tax=unclassified Xanthobacter TaxID=2623496 RepID=UPI001EDF312B|nr:MULTISPECIES: [NiFe]-hydrogenase assembly chaperone HybE [unclassified Xanthobacter]